MTTSASSSYSSITQPPAPCGFQDGSGNPYGCWADYLGYLPAGYQLGLAPHCVNCPIYQCPPGMNATQCKQFEASCGNGVCDPNETCTTCRIDCGGPQYGDICNPYTGRVGSPSSVCQVQVGTAYQLSIHLDRTLYESNQSMVVNGTISPPPSFPSRLAITIAGPTGVVLSVSGVLVNNDGTYRYALVTGGLPAWVTGTYTATVVWNAFGQNVMASANFNLAASHP